MIFTKSISLSIALKSIYFPSAMVARVNNFFGPIALRISCIKRVKFLVSSGEEDMPASSLVGYSQSISIPSRSYSFTIFWQSLAKPNLLFLSAAISLNRPEVQPPIDNKILDPDDSFLRLQSPLTLLGYLFSPH